MASLDKGKYALTFASGLGEILRHNVYFFKKIKKKFKNDFFFDFLGAQTAIISTLKTGDTIITGDDVYGGTNRLFRNLAINMGIEVIFVDMTKLENLKEALKSTVSLVWLETPTNPSMKVIDIAEVCKIVHEDTKAMVVVDNTFLSPYFQRPLELGADVVSYSVTK